MSLILWHKEKHKCIPTGWMSTTSLSNLCQIMINSLAHGRCGSNFTGVFFKLILQIGILGTSSEIGLRGVPQNPIKDKSTLGQVMAWCHQVTSHYLNQCWLWSLSPYGVTWPQWVRIFIYHWNHWSKSETHDQAVLFKCIMVHVVQTIISSK